MLAIAPASQQTLPKIRPVVGNWNSGDGEPRLVLLCRVQGTAKLAKGFLVVSFRNQSSEFVHPRLRFPRNSRLAHVQSCWEGADLVLSPWRKGTPENGQIPLMTLTPGHWTFLGWAKPISTFRFAPRCQGRINPTAKWRRERWRQAETFLVPPDRCKSRVFVAMNTPLNLHTGGLCTSRVIGRTGILPPYWKPLVRKIK